MKTQEIQKYIEMRNANKYDIMWFYQHYMDASQDKNMDLNKFQAVFQMANLESILEHIDLKFKVDRLYDSKGALIMVLKNNNK